MRIFFLSYDLATIAHILTWVVNSIYVLGLVPQIILNYRLKTGRGLSNIMLLGYMTAYVFLLFYVYCLNLPTSYKVLMPFAMFGVAIMIGQRYYYNHAAIPTYITMLYGVLALTAVSLVPLSNYAPVLVGNVTGWIASLIWSIYQIPQALKIYFQKSAQGFSFMFISIMAFGVFLELISALILKLPIQTLFTTTRALLAYSVFCIQFYIYRGRKPLSSFEQQ